MKRTGQRIPIKPQVGIGAIGYGADSHTRLMSALSNVLTLQGSANLVPYERFLAAMSEREGWQAWRSVPHVDYETARLSRCIHPACYWDPLHNQKPAQPHACRWHCDRPLVPAAPAALLLVFFRRANARVGDDLSQCGIIAAPGLVGCPTRQIDKELGDAVTRAQRQLDCAERR